MRKILRAERPRSGRSFTLVELLVVMAIMAILAALTFTGLHQAVEARERMRCLNSLRQWTIALEMYANDQAGVYPSSGELFDRTPQISAFMTNYLQISDSGPVYSSGHLPLAMCKSGIAKLMPNTTFIGWTLFAGYQDGAESAPQGDYAGVDFSNERTARDSGLAIISCLTAGNDAYSWSGHGVGGMTEKAPLGQIAAWPDGHARWVKREDLQVAAEKIVPFVAPDVPYYMPRKGI